MFARFWLFLPAPVYAPSDRVYTEGGLGPPSFVYTVRHDGSIHGAPSRQYSQNRAMGNREAESDRNFFAHSVLGAQYRAV